jgi:hypothetical protein
MAYSTIDVPWLLVDISLGPQPVALSRTRQASITLYSSQAGVAAKAGQWIGVNINLARKRSGSPLKDVDIDVEQLQEVVVSNTATLGLLGAVITAAFITRHDNLEILNGNKEEVTAKLRIACAQELEQRYLQRCGDQWDTKPLHSRIQALLDGTQDSASSVALPSKEPPKPTAAVGSLPAKKPRLFKGPWHPAEEQSLIDMRHKGKTWGEISTVIKENPLNLTEALLLKDGNVWWRAYESKNILDRLRGAFAFNDKKAIDELVAWLNRLQVGKDSISDNELVPGRNNAKKSTTVA